MLESEKSKFVFFQVQKSSSATEILPEEIVARIESFVSVFLRNLLMGGGGEIFFEMTKRNKSNFDEESGAFRLGKRTKKRKMKSKKSVRKYCQVWKLLSVVHRLVLEDKYMTQREIYYLLVQSFKDQTEFNEVVLDVVSILHVPREKLHIYASSRGFISGSLVWKERTSKKKDSVVTYSTVNLQNSVIHIPGYFPQDLQVQSKARYIIVVEKDGVFRRIVEDGFSKIIPCIIITACGYPDLGTRMVLNYLHKKLEIPIVGLFDYNPHGVSILFSYKFGSIRFGLEAFKYAVPIKWLGIHSSDIETLNLEKIPLTKNDEVVLKRLKNLQVVKSNPKLKAEIEKMSCKVEIQTLNNFGYDYLCNVYLKKKILQQKFI